MSSIDEISVHRLELPLRVPYKLALAAVAHLDTILVRVRTDRVGWGEATILTGYTDETVAESWALARTLAERLAGREVEAAMSDLALHFAAAPFVVSAVTAALEMAEGHPALDLREPVRVPILAVVNAMDPDGIRQEIEDHLAAGYGTLKVKVGFERAADLERVRLIQRLVAGRATLRLDGNQGYDRADGCAFAAALDPESIELFEQPCAAEDWESAVAVAKVSTVPMMLDESVYDLGDIRRAAELGAAKYVKLKLMKMGGVTRLEEGLSLIRSLGMEPVLGNGVATEVNCWMEACVAARLIRNAGEMNGFLKPVARLFAEPLTVRDGAICLAPNMTPMPDEEAVNRFTVDHLHAAARRAVAVSS